MGEVKNGDGVAEGKEKGGCASFLNMAQDAPDEAIKCDLHVYTHCATTVTQAHMIL